MKNLLLAIALLSLVSCEKPNYSECQRTLDEGMEQLQNRLNTNSISIEYYTRYSKKLKDEYYNCVDSK